MIGSNSRNQYEFTVSFISRGKFICLIFEEVVQSVSLCDFAWSFGLQSWYTGIFLFQEAIFSPSIKAVVSTCICAISLGHLNFRLHSLSVSLQNGSSSSNFLVKLFEFWAYVNSLDHLDCSLAVFYNKFFISVRKFLSPSMKAVVGTCYCAFSLDHLDFR